jgi:hypothetical protein
MRLDALEKAQGERERQSLADEIRQADAALRALGDEGDLEVKEAPTDLHAEEIEAMGGNTSAEEAISTADQMTSGGSPSLPQEGQSPLC